MGGSANGSGSMFPQQENEIMRQIEAAMRAGGNPGMNAMAAFMGVPNMAARPHYGYGNGGMGGMSGMGGIGGMDAMMNMAPRRKKKPDEPSAPEPDPSFAWAFPQYTQTWAFTPPPPTPYMSPPPFDPKKYGNPLVKKNVKKNI